MSSEIHHPVRVANDLGASSGRIIVSQNLSGKIELVEIHRFDNPSIGLHWNIFRLYHEILVGPVEASCSGNLTTQMLATDEIKNFDQGRQLIRDSLEYRICHPTDSDVWNQAYADFRKIFTL